MNKKEAIITELSQQLSSPKSTQRKAALHVLRSYDYASVEEILLAALHVESNKNLLEEFYEIFYANSSEDLFYKLYFEAKSVDDFQKVDEAKFKGMEELLSKMSAKLAGKQTGKSVLDYYRTAETRWNDEISNKINREKRQQKKIQNFIKKNDTKEANKEKKELARFAAISHAIGFAIVLVIWLCLRPETIQAGKSNPVQINDEVSQQDYSDDELEAAFIPDTAISIKAVILDSNAEYRQAMLQYDGKKYMLSFPDSIKIPAPGEELSCQIFVEDYIDGVYVAQVISVY